ncbi:MAG: pyruvate, phosphate dikinase [Alphaproteobacteria bacterium]|uniref:Pyruvate, phosphate dikinase n=1 Tax=PS1 clade bacterium TaxID=2175152 RepID=A0A368DQM9_9PROT|nr:pyruvate, phosphate dikinase [Rhodobiaceae bacterium]OUT73538.1 MAG: pyruvate, phosphate dikinase [Rhizobiales bacterium TMED25]RCL74150.1 MAG: pyruvate, phosphate dikinase [PS1 clade bacterium]|tara:strand:- start:96547 stop:99210 length:2664 start_codon:yes stop_codon:yes gene_type:complete
MNKWVYIFSKEQTDGEAKMLDLLGGKGANLAEMSKLGLPVPPGFTITTDVCNQFYKNDKKFPEDLYDQVSRAINQIEELVKNQFGSNQNPLLVSVRSGARSSMPGMLDTVLNLGLNDSTVVGLAKKSGDDRFAFDSYRRFIQMYSDVVLNIEHHYFEDILEDYKLENDYILDTDLMGNDWKNIVDLYKKEVSNITGNEFPQDVNEQLWGSISAVFLSWQNNRAVTYRRLNDIPDHWGTAVNIQAMVFGNLDDNSATGVAFTRNPSNGDRRFYGEFLVNAQGEDVVAGIRTPQNITEEARLDANSDDISLEKLMPKIYENLIDLANKLESHYLDMQDIEFTIQQGKLWILQTRSGKRTSHAAIKIAVDMHEEGYITKQVAISRINPASLDQLLHPTIDQETEIEIIAKGLPASPGAASGKIVFSADDAEKASNEGEKVILTRIETSPEDIHGMHAAQGILTTRGGMTSHAAVVARGMGRPCISGAGSLRIDYDSGSVFVNDKVYKAGDIITIDGTSGNIISGNVKMKEPDLSGDFQKVMKWADQIRKLKIRANAETKLDATVAKNFGAEGIGLCRTEHMFFEEGRINSVREMILAKDEEARRFALLKLLPMQKNDFVDLFKVMGDLPVTIRLLDPPLHEFLPHAEEDFAEVAGSLNIKVDDLKQRVSELIESNPMLGHRGCRLGITYPEIPEMQARAIFEASVQMKQEFNQIVTPEIMVPLITSKSELQIIKDVIDLVAIEISKKSGIKLNYTVGTMIELPRAALRSAEIAEIADFFSFGTNDLTQTTFGISRDDASKFLQEYVDKNILEKDPFVSIDVEGVGELIEISATRGRSINRKIKLGICGEHGGDPNSIDFCASKNLDYVSCSPYRVPIARLAAAQAEIKKK